MNDSKDVITLTFSNGIRTSAYTVDKTPSGAPRIRVSTKGDGYSETPVEITFDELIEDLENLLSIKVPIHEIRKLYPLPALYYNTLGKRLRCPRIGPRPLQT